jgi:hypothetical protein
MSALLRLPMSVLARISHQLSAAASYPSALTALRSVQSRDRQGAENHLRSFTVAALFSRRLATIPGEESGLGSRKVDHVAQR